MGARQRVESLFIPDSKSVRDLPPKTISMVHRVFRIRVGWRRNNACTRRRWRARELQTQTQTVVFEDP